MAQVFAKFKVISVTERVEYMGADSRPLVAEVRMQAIQHDTFGKYPPSGLIDMTINNPDAAKVFVDALRASTDSNGEAAEFLVTFSQ